MSDQDSSLGRSTADPTFLVVQREGHLVDAYESLASVQSALTASADALFVIAVQASAPVVRVDVSSEAETLAVRLGIAGGDNERDETIVAVGLSRGLAPAEVRLAFREPIIAISVAPLVDPLENFVAAELPILSQSLADMIRRLVAEHQIQNATLFADFLCAQIDANSRRQLLMALSALTVSTQRAVAVVGRADQSLLESLLQHRSVVRSTIAASAHDNVTRSLPPDFVNAVTDIDALTQFVLSRLTLDVSLAADKEAKARGLQEAEDRRNERRLERLGSALLVPALWTTFWSTRVAPQIDGPLGPITVICGAVLLAGIFWWLPWRNGPRKVKDDA